MLRRTGTLDDIVDEKTFAEMCGVTVASLRQWRQRKWVYSIEVPEPIFRPDGMKPVWMSVEASNFARKIKAKKASRRKK